MINNQSIDGTQLKKMATYLKYFWLYTLLVILWGAWVRISHSGDGCGNHWPTCGGALIPTDASHKTWIEYTHRLMSGLYGILVIVLFLKIHYFQKTQIEKVTKSFKFLNKMNWLFLFLMFSEALLGAVLVKGELVTENDSVLRLFVMSFHQLNSFLLTGVTYLLAVWFNKNGLIDFLKSKKILVLFLMLPITGAIAALSTTLFPSISVWQGILQDFYGQSHLFIRLRILHPMLAIIIALGFVSYCYMKNNSRLAIEFLCALTIGLITLFTLSPVFLKLIHLFMAHYLWSRLLYMFVSRPDSSSR